MHQIGDLFFCQIVESDNAGSTRDKTDIHRSCRDDLTDAFPAKDQITQIVFWYRSKHDLDIGESKIRVQDNDTLPHLTEHNRQVYRHIGFANAPLATGDRDHAGIANIILIFLFDNIS